MFVFLIFSRSHIQYSILHTLSPIFHGDDYESVTPCRGPLLGSDSETYNETTSAAKQQILNKEQLNYNKGTVFSTRSVSRCYTQDNWSNELVVSCGILASG
jgi:hypothetical protein